MHLDRHQTLFLLLISIIISLAVSEIIVLRLGWQRHKPPYEESLHDKWLYTFDSERGWKNRPGVYHLAKLYGDLPHTITILPDGSRKTHARQLNTTEPPIIMIGDSYLHGFGLDDDKTIGWKVQKIYQNREVYNLGVNGYSTWQTFLTLKDYEKITKPNSYFIYGFIADHLNRTVVTPQWVNTSNRMISINNLFMPFLRDLGNGRVITGKARLPSLPFSSQLALIHVVEIAYTTIRYNVSEEVKWRSLSHVLQKMNEHISANHSKLIVVLLGDRTEVDPFRALFRELALTTVDCTIESQDFQNYLLKADLHPNPIYTDLIAEKIVDIVGKEVERSR